MKAMLAACVDEAVKLALIDVAMVVETIKGRDISREHRVLESAGPLSWERVPGPATLQRAAEASGVELREPAPFGHVSEVHALIYDFWSVEIEGDDRFRFHVPFDADVLIERYPTTDEQDAWRQDIYQMPSRALANIDPGALARCVGVRLLGPGNWMVGDVYAGNATVQELVDASFERPNRSLVDELAFDIGAAVVPEQTLTEVDPDETDDEDEDGE